MKHRQKKNISSKVFCKAVFLLVCVFFLTSCSKRTEKVSYHFTAERPSSKISSINCGPKALLEICKFYDISATEEELIKLSDTQNGTSTFFGISKAAKAKGLECIGAKAGFDMLKELVLNNQIIVHFSENHHFVLVKAVKDKTVTVYNPALRSRTRIDVPIHLFIEDWDGNILIINRELHI